MPTPAIRRILTTRTVRSLLFRRRPQPLSSSGETRSPLSHRTRLARCPPMPALRRPDDRHRGLRARLRAKVAADPKHDPHIMSKTACERRRLPVPLRWPHARGDLSRRNHANQRADRPLIRSTPPAIAVRLPGLAPRPIQVAPRQLRAHHQIPIAPAAPTEPQNSRDFVLWRFSTRAAGASGASVMPASKNLHSSSLSTWRNKCGQPRRASDIARSKSSR